MKSRRSFLLVASLGLLPAALLASLAAHDPSPKRDLSGKIVEIHKRQPIVVLENFQGWDREQGVKLAVVEKSAVRRWLEGLGPKQAALYLKAEDVKGLKRGMIVKIKGYSYSSAGSCDGGRGLSSVHVSYDELKVEDGK